MGMRNVAGRGLSGARSRSYHSTRRRKMRWTQENGGLSKFQCANGFTLSAAVLGGSLRLAKYQPTHEAKTSFGGLL